LLYPDLSETPEERIHYEACQRRLDQVLRIEGDKTQDFIPDDVQTFEQFLNEFPNWKDEKSSFIFHRDHPTVKNLNVLAQRVQKSGLCYLHAPEMVQHYVVSLHTKTFGGMIDMSKMIRETFNAQQLEDYIFKDVGGPSDIMLKLILQPKSIILAGAFKDAMENLKQFGPLLVSRFEVYGDFDHHSHHHHGMRKNDHFEGYHAMVLIGVRIDSKGNKYFLLQNWWSKKQFFEVDEAYLKSCGPTLYYVETPQLEIPKQFPKYFAKFGENENLDKPETYPMIEGPLKGAPWNL